VTIAIDYTPAFHQRAGIGRLVRDLVSALFVADPITPYRLFVAGSPTPSIDVPDNFQWKSTPISPEWLARIWHRAHFPIPVELFTGKVDLYHATDFTLPPVAKRTKTIVTVHDLSFVRVPDAAPAKLRNYLNSVVPRSVKRADMVIADSVATRDDLIDLYKINPEKIEVLYSGVEKRYQPMRNKDNLKFVLEKYKIPSVPYLLTVGTVQPRKNYARIVEALNILHIKGFDLHLVIAGQPGWLQDDLYETVRRLNLDQHVHITGFVDEADLPILYSHAQCVPYPSLYEGFGFPILESMACGVPVVTSNVSSLPEVAGGAAVLVDPYDVESLASAIQKILQDSDFRSMLVKRGFEQIKNFTWEQTATSLIRLYNQIL
jgi:glycosyltransferase involved in cell wall biosynthesis